jgi:hypothetical protein
MRNIGEPQTLHVLAQENGVAVADLSEAANPVVVFDDNAMAKLLLLVRDVHTEMKSSPAPALGRLLAELGAVLEQYRVARNKYFAGVSGRVDAASQVREVEALFKELEKFHRPG